MPDLRQLDKNALSAIITGFANKGKIFQSEAQFQFELAWELQLREWGKACLEEMSMYVRQKSNDKVVKKFYTDIVIDQDGYRVAIELKYKTATYTGNNIVLFNHGAADLGRYDYLWDVFRIEMLKDTNKKNIPIPHINDDDVRLDVPDLKRCNRGFAVLLTNESKYWTTNYKKPEDGTQNIDNQFCIGCNCGNKGILFGKKLDWKKDNNGKYPKAVLTKNGNQTARARPILLNNAYSYEWENYLDTSPTNGQFRFVIIEVS